jgi:hypothetical protein
VIKGAAILSANSIASNTASTGGGLYLYESPATLSANSIVANRALANHGGGLFLESSNATLSANSIAANVADYGGGLFLDYGSAMLSANSVTSNSATYGGGLVVASSDATLTNTIVAGNQASAKGSGLYISGAVNKPVPKPRLLHTTLAGNGGNDGSGLYLDNAYGGTASAWLTNTILVSQSVGITVAEGCTATMNGTLWYDNGTDWGGAGTLTHSVDYIDVGSPAFVDPDHGDYHIGPGSAAINRGVSAGVTTDKDGLPRDIWPDLGAYEFQGPMIDTYLPAMWKGPKWWAETAPPSRQKHYGTMSPQPSP